MKRLPNTFSKPFSFKFKVYAGKPSSTVTFICAIANMVVNVYTRAVTAESAREIPNQADDTDSSGIKLQQDFHEISTC